MSCTTAQYFGSRDPGVVNLGWIPSSHQDLSRYPRLGLHSEITTPPLPETVDLQPYQSPVKSQGKSNSCTCYATAAAIDALSISDKDPIDYSEPFIYNVARLSYNHQDSPLDHDEGLPITAPLEVLKVHGDCPFATWPSMKDQDDYMHSEPSQKAYERALNYQVTEAVLVEMNALKHTLAKGIPVIAGIFFSSNFDVLDTMATGIIPISFLSSSSDKGHCILLVGYDEVRQQWKFKNSWGENWGDNGYGFLPFHYDFPPEMWAIMAQKMPGRGIVSWYHKDPHYHLQISHPQTPVENFKLLGLAQKGKMDVEFAQRGFVLSSESMGVDEETKKSKDNCHCEEASQFFRKVPIFSMQKRTTTKCRRHSNPGVRFPVLLSSQEVGPIASNNPADVQKALDDSPTIVVATTWPKNRAKQASIIKSSIDTGHSWINGLCAGQVQKKIDEKLLKQDDAMGIAAYYALCKDYYIRNVATTWLTKTSDRPMRKTYDMNIKDFHSSLISDVFQGLSLSKDVLSSLDNVLNVIASSIKTSVSQKASFYITLQRYNWNEQFGEIFVTWRSISFTADSSTKEFVSHKSHETKVHFDASLQITDYDFRHDFFKEHIEKDLNALLISRGSEETKKAQDLAGPDLAPPP